MPKTTTPVTKKKKPVAATPATEVVEGYVVVREPKRFHIESRPNRLAALQAGESEAITKRLDLDSTTVEALNKEVVNLRSSLCRSAAQASERSAKKFEIETGEFRTRAGNIMLVAVATCVE